MQSDARRLEHNELARTEAWTDEEAIVRVEDLASFPYIREHTFLNGRPTLKTSCRPPRLGHVPGRLVAYPIHSRGWRGHRWVRLWYVADQDFYGPPGPIEAVVPESIAPGKQSLPYSLAWGHR